MVSCCGYTYISLIMTNDGKYLFMVSWISGKIFIAKLLFLFHYFFILFLNCKGYVLELFLKVRYAILK